MYSIAQRVVYCAASFVDATASMSPSMGVLIGCTGDDRAYVNGITSRPQIDQYNT